MGREHQEKTGLDGSESRAAEHVTRRGVGDHAATGRSRPVEARLNQPDCEGSVHALRRQYSDSADTQTERASGGSRRLLPTSPFAAETSTGQSGSRAVRRAPVPRLQPRHQERNGVESSLTGPK